MGLINKLFGNKESGITLNAPVSGKVLKMEDVPDQVFSQKMMGDGFAIEPRDGKIYSPVNAKVASLFPTGHAIGLVTADGLEILIHFGVDTVNLNGEGFEALVKVGDEVKAGDLLISVDFEDVKGKVPSTITPVIFTNLAGYVLDYSAIIGNDIDANTELLQLAKK